MSNRLPVQWNAKEKKFQPSSGGLVSAIKGVKLPDWKFSWCGIISDDADTSQLPCEPFPCHAIKVTSEQYDLYYNAFCNDVLWPLFHYEHSRVRFTEKAWKAYTEVNQTVADSLASTAKKNAIIWVHDFHFMLLPEMLKRLRPDLRIGFFLHIPFPSSEIFRQLPCRNEILTGLLAADLVGFHDASYMNHFQTSVHRLIGLETDTTKIESSYHTTRLGVFPISIETQHFMELAASAETKTKVQELVEEKKDKQWLLGVDRLDYSKGLLLKFKAFQQLLRRYPQWRGKVQLRQIVIPSRTDVKEYQRLKEKIDQLVGAINGEFGDMNYVPVLYQFSSVDQTTLSALYRTSDAVWVTSRRDGMNLVCLEYVASQDENCSGNVLLSEFTGAHSTLSFAISINPWDIDGSADQVVKALEMPAAERCERMRSMKHFLEHYTSTTWAQTFLEGLPRDIHSALPRTKEVDTIIDRVADSSILFLDYDGTLAAIRERPELALPVKEVQDQLVRLRDEGKHLPCIVSGRPMEFFERHFFSQGIHLPIAANHGASYYDPAIREWLQLAKPEKGEWYESVKQILQIYTDRTPGSFIEEKCYGLAWHYRMAPPEFASFVAKKLTIELYEALAGSPAQVIGGKKVVEIRHQSANKGHFVDWYLASHPGATQVIAVGDDETDEDMFRHLAKVTETPCLSVKVGPGATAASLRFHGTENVLSFLSELEGRTHESRPA